jgi:DNA-binding CsgD family transcriptional regulator
MGNPKDHSPFIKSNPLYAIATKQNFANEKIEFKPIIDVLELLFGRVALGNFFINVTDFRDYTFPYHSPGVFTVSGYRHEDIGGMEWLDRVLHPDDNPIFMEYSVRILSYIQQLSIPQKQRTMINHCYRIRHGKANRYIWIYQQHHLSHVDNNGSIVYSISLLTDVTHLLPDQMSPSWSVTERLQDGTMLFHIGSENQGKIDGFRQKPTFTSREVEILKLAAQGFQNKEIAKQIGVGYETVLTHKKSLLKKTKSKNMAEVVAYAINLGFI